VNTLNITPLQDGICYCCQDKQATHHYRFAQPRGFGSAFDMLNVEFHCCDECNRKRFEKWFSEVPQITDGYIEHYIHEQELCKFVESLPVNVQERVYNASDLRGIDAQDWIDIRLGELSPELKEKYGLDDELFDTEYEI